MILTRFSLCCVISSLSIFALLVACVFFTFGVLIYLMYLLLSCLFFFFLNNRPPPKFSLFPHPAPFPIKRGGGPGRWRGCGQSPATPPRSIPTSTRAGFVGRG